jgi:regulator of sigma E protease
VRLDGEDGDDTADPRSFVNARLPVKLIVLVAGVVMNVVLAFVIFTAIAFMGDPTIGVRVGAVQADSPAAAAGINPGDVVASIDGRYFEAFGDESILNGLQANAGRTVTLGVERADGRLEQLQVTLRDRDAVIAGQGALGISELAGRTTQVSISRPLPDAVAAGAERTGTAMRLILDGLAGLINSIRTDPTAPPDAAGPVGIAIAIGDVFWQLGPVITLYMAGLLSANLAVINILPFPPLDGGRILVLVLKAIFGRRISVQAERLTYLVGFVFLFAFLIWITGFDILRQLGVTR